LGGEARDYLGRLSSDTAALQKLTADPDGTTLTWTRSGASPEVWRVTFEQSTDGVSYVPLGEGMRNGGWQVTGLALARGQSLWVRARGHYATGMYNGSGSVVESVRYIYLAGQIVYLPLILRE
jgi:hypothetical protein